MNSTDILGVGQELNLNELWDTVPGSVSGIRNTHCVIPLTSGAIHMMYYTDADHGSEKKIWEAEAMVFTQSVVLLSEENTGAIAQANKTEVSSMPVQHDVATHASTSTATSASVLNCGSYQAGTITMGLLPDTQNCGCACAGNAGNVFPVTAGKRSRHASRHVRHARAVMHAGIANYRFPLKLAAGENVPVIPGACATCNFTYLVRGP